MRGILLVAVVCSGCTEDAGNPGGPAGADGGFQSLPNGALHFNGTSDYATTGTAQFPTGLGPQTISLWVRYTAIDARDVQVFVTLRKDLASGINLGIRGGQIAAWGTYGSSLPSSLLVATPKLPSIGVWHNVAFVLDQTDSGNIDTLYVDGNSVATTTNVPDKLTPLSSWLGSPDGTSDFLSGDMDEIRIFNVARSSAEVLRDMNGQTSPEASGLAAYFNCDAIKGDRVLDNSGNGNDATLGGGDKAFMPTLVPSGAP